MDEVVRDLVVVDVATLGRLDVVVVLLLLDLREVLLDVLLLVQTPHSSAEEARLELVATIGVGFPIHVSVYQIGLHQAITYTSDCRKM